MKSEIHDLADFMSVITNDIQRDYERIQKRVREDPGTAGDEGEENWAKLLRSWLPPQFPVVTKGRIISHDPIVAPSGQIDVLVLSPSYPVELRNVKHYLAGGILAAFECKVTLKKTDVRRAFSNAVRIKHLSPPRTGTPYRELQSPIICGLLAHSHRLGKAPFPTLEREVYDSDLQVVKHPKEMLDLICVADLAFWASIKNYHRTVSHSETPSVFPLIRVSEPSLTWYSGFERESTTVGRTPVGSLISSLLTKLAWEDSSLRRLADYFKMSGISGLGRGNARIWDRSIYSEELVNRDFPVDFVSDYEWNEWTDVFW